ncbi:OprD family outer membrane porin [Salegentibacter chungangensis]|uniref:OprD family outer membrane porin n=1 Tax=Salegentibacter chungangensis TaxID=1335724 RepID=A0ABW3NPL8_9FLAO
MIRSFIPTVLFILLAPFASLAQETTEKSKRGKLSGQLRTYYMNTFNKGSLKDFRALAVGGKIKYQYRFNDNLEFGLAGYNSTNTWIQDLTIPDTETGKLSRYEEGLFDRLNLDNKFVFLLGELYMNYGLEKHEFRLGRMKIKSPLVNPEDGRMIPSLFQGFLYQYKPSNRNNFQFGIFNEVAPRSTGEFYPIGESIGTYGVGRDWSGSQSQYKGNTESDFLVVSNVKLEVTDRLNFEIWDYYIDNVSNSVYFNPKFDVSSRLELQMEWLHQNKIGEGGNEIDSLSYFRANSSDVLGMKLKYKWPEDQASVSLAYDRILPHGQFIFPREWGREFLFSFQKRERSEGTADNHALVMYYEDVFQLNNPASKIQTILSVGHQWKPSVANAKLNKYAVPDYTHINLDLFFHFEKLKNLKPELLFVTKFSNGDVPDNPNLFLNKTDLFHVDVILNYTF